jgi:hypothetical protein
MLTDDQILSRADQLASHAAMAGVHEDQLAIAFAHLKRHQDVTATLRLLADLMKSSFARRSRQTPAQFRAMELHVRTALQNVRSWQDAASIVGWARRLVKYHQSKERRPQPQNWGPR